MGGMDTKTSKPATPPLVRATARRAGELARRMPRWVDPLALVGIASVVGGWWALSGVMSPIRLPSPPATVETMVEHFTSSPVIASQGIGEGGIAPHLGTTVVRTVVGVAIGGAIGLILGLTLGLVEPLRRAFQPVMDALRVTPSLVAAPFLILWFGLNPAAQIGLVAFYTAVVLQVNVFTAVRNLSPDYERFAATLGADKRRRIRTVILPGIVPELTGGLRVALQLSWGLVVVAELIGAQTGLGRMMSTMFSIFRTDIIVAGILWLALVAVLFDWLFKRLLYRTSRWTESLGAGGMAG